ncbi:MAG: YigZ family protein [Flavobacteriaceae bacterium]|nr:YigZ family protein [Flavobacteriaceae bacterium]
MKDKDSYLTIVAPSEEILFKDRNSKFFGYAFPVTNDQQVKSRLKELKSKHHSAGHWCYAFQIGVKNVSYRVNDDGEPNNSAGMPIYGQIQSYGITNVLIVVVRYFGGTKLGVGGLINACRITAQWALEASSIVEKTINKRIQIVCPYEQLNKVMRLIKTRNLKIIHQEMELGCKLEIEVRLKDSETIFDYLKTQKNIKVKYLDDSI